MGYLQVIINFYKKMYCINTIVRYLPNHQSHSQTILLYLQYYFTLEYWLSQLEGNGLENLEQVFVIGKI
jgi:hypothetical protein